MTLPEIARELRREVRVLPRNTPAAIEQAERLVKLAEEIEQCYAVARRAMACVKTLARELERLGVKS